MKNLHPTVSESLEECTKETFIGTLVVSEKKYADYTFIPFSPTTFIYPRSPQSSSSPCSPVAVFLKLLRSLSC